MLETLKEATKIVENFNNTPDECRYYYDEFYRHILHITEFIDVSIKPTNGNKRITFFLGGDVVDKKDCRDSAFFYNDIKLVSLEEARQQKSKYENSLQVRYINLKSELRYLEQEIERTQQCLMNGM